MTKYFLFPRTKKCWLGQQSQVGQEYGGTSFYFLKLKGIKCLLKDKIKRAKKDMESTRTSAGTSDQSTLIAITAAGSSLFLHIPSGQICLLLDLSASYWIKPPFALRYLSDFPQNCFHVLPKITTQGKKTQERSLTIQGCKLPTCHPNRAAPTLRLLCCHWHTLTKGESFIAITAELHTVILGKPVGCVCCSHAQHYRSCTAIYTSSSPPHRRETNSLLAKNKHILQCKKNFPR